MIRVTKKNSLPAFFLILFPLITSCISYTTKNVWDSSVPPDQTARLKVHTSLTVTSYNGRAVSFKRPMFDRGHTGIILPAGNADLLLKVSAAFNYGNIVVVYSGQNVAIRYFFEPGKTYELYFGRKREGSIVTGTVKYGIFIKERKVKTRDADFFEVKVKS
ncbi:MAG: hypothetical protein LBQ55_06780 [Treponema sp.]|jgi:hypothetical protein|nr:hypothetical protein [Treponema sp.]